MYEDSYSAELAAVHHLLAAPGVARRARPHVSGDEIDWAGLLAEAETMSGGEQLLVRIACELWHAQKLVGLWELTRRLDAGGFERVVTAFRVARDAPRAALAA